MNKEVWNRALIDTIGLEQYFQNHDNNYQWDERLDAIVFGSNKIQEIEMVRNMLSQTYYIISETILSFNIYNAT